MAFAPNQSSPCPPGFSAAAPTDLTATVDTSRACACSAPCTVLQPPTCDAQGEALQEWYDDPDAGSNACTTMYQDVLIPTPGACWLGFGPAYWALDVMFQAPTVYGTCAGADGVQVGPAVLGGPARACVPDSPEAAGCVGDRCTLALPAPYRVCIDSSPAFHLCPAGSVFTQPHDLETGFSLGCGPCNCDVTATCPGTLALFSDTQCMNDEIDIAADSTCRPPVSGLSQASSFEYVRDGGPADVTCTQGFSAGGGAGINPQTVCCMP
ncbi:MAG TPA: hypothetical protein VK762_06355 [Polyangiaceae bacterium]|nr:hypothetical protein [Polyangiaceae bacterium]